MIPLMPLLVNRIKLVKACPILYRHVHRRLKSDSRKELTFSKSQDSKVDANVQPLGERIKETTKTTYNVAIILVGLGAIGAMSYAIFRELFSSSSPNNLYSKAVKKCIQHTQISDKLGQPISAFGEETRRGRRQHVSHAFYFDKDGQKHIRMKFHLKGTAHSGTAHLDMIEADSGKFEYRYLFVEIDDMFKSVIVLEDNRSTLDSHTPSSASDLELVLDK